MTAKKATPKIGVCTIIAKNYLPQARTLMQSVKVHHPDWKQYVLLTDEIEGYFQPNQEIFEVWSSSQLLIPKNSLFHFKYDLMELATAVKPYLLKELFNKEGLDVLLYLDPDILVVNSLAPITQALETANVVLTPHLTTPIKDDKSPGEIHILQAGVYNLGFVGLRWSKPTSDMLDWWQEKLSNDCISDVTNGYFVDQSWMSLVPGLFEGVSILRDPGLNLAYWNLAQRPVSCRNGVYYAGNHLLRFFHFSGFNPENPEPFSKHQNRLTFSKLGAAQPLVRLYIQKMLANGYRQCKTWPYYYGFLRDGSEIPNFARRLVRDDLALQQRLEGAFNPADDQALLNYFNEPAFPVQSGQVLTTRLLYYLYTRRADLQQAFPQVPGKDSFALAHWFVQHARPEYNLSQNWYRPLLENMYEFISADYSPNLANEPDAPSFLDKYLVRWLNWPAPVAVAKNQPRPTLTAYHIYNIDSDAHQLFPNWPKNNLKEYPEWFVKTAAEKYGLPPFLTAPMRSEVSSSLSTPPINVLSQLKHSSGGLLLIEWMNSMVAAPGEKFKLPLTQFAYYFWQLDPDLAQRFALGEPKQWEAYTRWFVEKAAEQYQLPRQFIEPMKIPLEIADFEQKLTPFERLLLNLLNQPLDGPERDPVLTVAAYRCYALRADLWGTFPEPLKEDRTNFASWFATSALKEMELHPALVTPIRNSLHLPISSPANWPTNFLAQLQKSSRGRQLVNWLNQEYEPGDVQRAKVSRLAYYIYSTDPQAQREFKEPLRYDRKAFARWFISAAADKYHIPNLFLESVRGSLGISADAGSQTSLLAKPRLPRWQFNRNFINSWQTTGRPTFNSHLPAGSEATAVSRPTPTGWADNNGPSNGVEYTFGLNIIGYLSAPTGVGEAARRTIAAAQVGNIPFSTRNLVDEGFSDNDYVQAYTQTQQNGKYGLNLIQVNADMLPEVASTLGPVLRNRYNIGYWYWETSDFPAAYQQAFQHVNEVWVASSFAQQAIAYKSSVPVVKIPPCISPVVAPNFSRASFGLPADRFLFLTMFDIMSIFERKNPFAVIEAFEAAFKGNYHDVGLVLKISNAAKNLTELAVLRDRLARLPAYLIEDYLDQSEVNALTASIDCTVSLHRAEGFGLTLAEAMYLGKPVIATAYSGNMDFTNSSNSLLVDYELVQLQQNYGPYLQGTYWAEPDIEQAAHYMRQLVEDSPLRQRLAHRGQLYIREHYSPETVSQMIRQRGILLR